jgi:5-methylcytosine-specific restriction protein A
LGINTEQGGTGGNSKKPFIDIDPQKISGKNRSLSELRDLALNSTEGVQSTTQKQREIYIRANAIKEYVLKRADGICEYCSKAAPFVTKLGPYLECHHILRLSDGGPDHPMNVIGICPNCHREAHYALDKEEINQAMLKAVGVLEALPEESI